MIALPLLLIALPFLYLFLHINRTRITPLNWPIVGMLPGIILNAHRLLDQATDMLAEAPDRTVFFRGPWLSGMNFVMTCDPANGNHIFNTHFNSYVKGDPFREVFDIMGLGLFSCDDELWKHQRKIGHVRVNNADFRSSVPRWCVEKVEKGLLPFLSQMERSDKAVDLQEVFKRFIFDMTCTFVLGVDPRSLDPSFPAIPFASALIDAEDVLFLRYTVPPFWWKLQRLLGIGAEKRMTTACQVIERFIEKCISEREEGSRVGHSADLLTLYTDRDIMDYVDGQVPDGSIKEYLKSRKFVRDTLMAFLSGGKDSTGVTLSWFFYMLSNNPNVEKKILQELREVRSSKAAGEERMVVFDSYEEIESLVYLHAALCESLRLHPSLPINIKHARSDEVLPSGHKVRPGMPIIFSMYSSGRMKSVWGEDCLEFKPERWIDPKNGKLKHEPSYKSMPFGCGPRTCIGKNISVTEIKLAAAAVVYNFQIEAVEGCVVEPMPSIVMTMKNGFMVKLRKRDRE